MAQVALLHTDMYSGFKLAPRIGINSPGKETKTQYLTRFPILKLITPNKLQ